jgi:RNA polymerase sigma-70 factor (ECF subfamily)
METTSNTLLERLRDRGDRVAWRTFEERYSPLIKRWGRSIGLNTTDADELSQEVFLTLAKKVESYDRSKGRFRTWLKTVTINKFREMYRSRRLGGVHEPIDERSSDLMEERLDRTFEREFAGRVLEVIETKFGANGRRLIERLVLDGASAGEVGRELNRMPNTVSVMKFRILEWLRGECEELFDS